jgi:hypothetical protein
MSTDLPTLTNIDITIEITTITNINDNVDVIATNVNVYVITTYANVVLPINPLHFNLVCKIYVIIMKQVFFIQIININKN